MFSLAHKGDAASRVLLIGRHELLMAFLADQLRRHDQFQVVSVVPSSALASHIVRERPVDVIILDLDIAGDRCMEDVNLIHKNCPSTRWVFLASQLTDQIVEQALTAGAAGLLLKDKLAKTFVSNLLDIMAGGASYPAAVASHLVGEEDGHPYLGPKSASLQSPQSKAARQFCSPGPNAQIAS